MTIPLIILGTLSAVAGVVEVPRAVGSARTFSAFVDTAFSLTQVRHEGVIGEGMQGIIALVASLAGVSAAYLLFFRFPPAAERVASSPVGNVLRRFWFSGWGFDWLYERIFIKPLFWLARMDKDDFVDLLYGGIVWYSTFFSRAFVVTQSGKVRWYAMGITLGAVITIGIVVALS